jgi:hypothetical protein
VRTIDVVDALIVPPVLQFPPSVGAGNNLVVAVIGKDRPRGGEEATQQLLHRGGDDRQSALRAAAVPDVVPTFAGVGEGMGPREPAAASPSKTQEHRSGRLTPAV